MTAPELRQGMARGFWRRLRQGLEIWRLRLAARRSGPLSVYYGRDHVPSPGEEASGGILKFQRLATALPNSPRKFNLVYFGSNNVPRNWRELLHVARSRGVPFVYNQNGAGWYDRHSGRGEEYVETGRYGRAYHARMATLLQAADYVFFQSEFCFSASNRFLGRRTGASEILYNAVDTQLYAAAPSPPERPPLRLLMSGKQYQDYPVESTVRATSALRRSGVDVRLMIAGRLVWAGSEEESRRELEEWSMTHGVADRIELLGPYSQLQAPSVHHRAHILVHAKYNDACPSGVIEAMACGIPVAYSKSGGTPELVGEEGGVGIDVPQGWAQMYPPDPDDLARAIMQIATNHERFSQRARRRAQERFDLRHWTRRHLEVFGRLLESAPPRPSASDAAP